MAGLEDTELFVEIARVGGFAAAEATTGLKRSVLSRRLARLERRLGVQLAKRSPKGFALTPAGEQLIEACAGALERVRKAEAALAQRQTTPSGLVRVTAPAPIVHVFLSEELDAFLARHPEVNISVDVTGQKAALRDEPFDLALRVGEVGDDNLVARRLFIECEAVYASPRWVERHGAPAIPADLNDSHVIRCAGQDTSSSDGRWYLTDKKEEAEVPVCARVTVNDAVAAREIVSNGDLLGSLPRFIADPYVEQGRLIRLLPDWTSPRMIIRAVLPHKPTAAARALLDYLVGCADHRWRDD